MALESNRRRTSAFGAAETTPLPFPVRVLHDRTAGRLEIVADVYDGVLTISLETSRRRTR
ncbi:hypothetical protein HT576_01315 [Haloterrigena sp. SYSU A121-1]|uniref:Uncharacterized protein n=1 Tax=Haloterrigena gelatinilytica TaxID=2741724 RepID=A0A8J8GGT0_9EURY|nr:hypothetical protein [Haloterrigena gelatinilytica]NUB89674.1 hypothetical protein [Haloterrigena gelatinilytica]